MFCHQEVWKNTILQQVISKYISSPTLAEVLLEYTDAWAPARGVGGGVERNPGVRVVFKLFRCFSWAGCWDHSWTTLNRLQPSLKFTAVSSDSAPFYFFFFFFFGIITFRSILN